MKRLILFFTLIFMMSAASFGQNITEYGKPSELKGVTKIFVLLNMNGGEVQLKDRDRIIKEIENAKKKNNISNLEIVDRMEDAEVVLLYSESNQESLVGVNTNNTNTGANSTPVYTDKDIGKGRVVKVTSTGTLRLLMDYKNTQKTYFEKSPATNFGRAFMKAYIAANTDSKEKDK